MFFKDNYQGDPQNDSTTNLSVGPRTTQDLAHVEDSRQATPSRKLFDHYAVHCLRDNIDQRADQLLFAITYVVDNNPSWRILSAIIVHGAQACYRSMHQSHLTKKHNYEHSSNPSSSSTSGSQICVACPETRLMTKLGRSTSGQYNPYSKRIESRPLGRPRPANASLLAERYKLGDGRAGLHG